MTITEDTGTYPPPDMGHGYPPLKPDMGHPSPCQYVRLASGQYGSYWNAFLLQRFLIFSVPLKTINIDAQIKGFTANVDTALQYRLVKIRPL